MSNPDLGYLGPLITAIGVVVVGLTSSVALVWRRRQDRKDVIVDKDLDRLPTEADGWTEVRAARAEATKYYNFYRTFENLYYIAASALRHLVRTVHDAHPEQVFDKDITDALATKPPDVNEGQ